MARSRSMRCAVCAVGALVALSMPLAAQAAIKTWAAASSGQFAQGFNWTPSGVPGTTDSATFSAIGTYTVTLGNSPVPLPNPTANQDLFFTGGNVTLTSGVGGPYTYQLKGGGGSDANITGGTLSLGTSGNPLHLSVGDDLVVRNGASLNVNHGSTVAAADLLLAQGVGGGGGDITVDGAGSQLNATSGATQSLGLNGNSGTLTYRNGSSGSFTGPLNVGVSNDAGTAGVLNLQTGAQSNLGNLAVGTGTAGTGTVNISGAGSALVQSGAATLTVGAASGGVGAMNIGTTTTGATLTTGTGLFTINETGTVTVGGASTVGTLNANGDVTIDGGLLDVRPLSSFSLAAGRTFTAQNGGGFLKDNYTTAANATYNFVGFGSRWEGTSFTILGGSQVNVHSDGLLLGNSVLLSGNTVYVGNDGTLATLNIGATASGGRLIGNLSIGEMGTVNIGSATTTGELHAPFSINVEGGVLQVNPGSTFMLGGSIPGQSFRVSDGGRATFDLDGGNYTTAAPWFYDISDVTSTWEFVDGSGLRISGFSSVSVSGGVLSAAGDVSVLASGGLFLSDGGTLTANALSVTGNFSFVRGTLGITGAAGLTLAQKTLGVNTNSFSVDPDHNLNVTNATTIPAGWSLSVDGGTFNTGSLVINGNFSFNSGTLGITGPAGLTIGTGGLFGATLVLNSNQTLNVTNTLAVDAGAKLIALSAGGLSAGPLLNNGDLVAVDSTIDAPVVNNNAVTVVGTVEFNGLVSGPGDFYGPGTAHFNGGLGVGASPADVGFEGSLALADTNTLFIEIGGATPGSQYDRLSIAGAATLDGALDVSLTGGFTPSAGQQFTILTAGSIVNNGFTLGGPAASSFNLIVGSTSVILQAIGLDGDYDFDGDVDGADFLKWQRGESPNPLSAADLATWRANFGMESPVADASTAAPEPSACIMLLVGMTAIGSRRRRIGTAS